VSLIGVSHCGGGGMDLRAGQQSCGYFPGFLLTGALGKTHRAYWHLPRRLMLGDVFLGGVVADRTERITRTEISSEGLGQVSFFMHTNQC
jgi:hypothetical protein